MYPTQTVPTTGSSTTTTWPPRRSSIGLAKSERCRRGEAPGGAAAVDRRVRSRSRTAARSKLDSRRQAIQDQYQLQLVKNADGSVGRDGRCVRPGCRSVVRRPLHADEPAAGPHAAAVQEAEDAVAGQDQGRHERQDHEPGPQVGRLTEAPASRTRRAGPPLAGGRPAFRRPPRRLATSTSRSRPASGARSSARTGPARRRSSTSSAATSPPPPGTVELFGRDVTHAARAHAGAGWASRAPTSSRASSPASPSRTTSTSRSSASAAATFARSCSPRDAEIRERAREAARPRRDRPQAFASSSARSRTASTARSRSASRSPPSRR